MKFTTTVAMLATGLLMSGATLDAASAQSAVKGDAEVTSRVTATTGGSWMVRTMATANCPALTVNVVRNGSTVTGTAASGDMLAISKVTGTDDGTGHFTLNVVPVESAGPKGTITGSVDFASKMLTAKFQLAGCPDGSLKIPYYEPSKYPLFEN